MRNKTIIYSIRFVTLAFLQVFILNKINFLGYLNPYLYIMFILFLPVDYAKWKLLLVSFFLGLTIDMFSDSGGIHAASCLIIAQFRPFILQTIFGISYENQTINLYRTNFKERVLYWGTMVLLHHFILFSLTFFSFKHVHLILKNTVYSTLFTLILILISTVLFTPTKRKN